MANKKIVKGRNNIDEDDAMKLLNEISELEITGKIDLNYEDDADPSADGDAPQEIIDDTEDLDHPDRQISEEHIYSGLIMKSYVLLKQIGYGNNAIVWLAYRMTNDTYVAVKVQDHQCYIDGCREVSIIDRINSFSQINPNVQTYCVKMLDYFTYKEKNETRYVCSVYDLYAESIHCVLRMGIYKYGLPIDVVKNITRQLLKALDLLHTEPKLSIIHTDVKPQNILFKGITDYNQNVITIFKKSGFIEKYQQLKRENANDETKLSQEVEILALECVQEIRLLKINPHAETLEPDTDSDDERIIGDYDDYDEDLDCEDEDDDNDRVNDRKQSVNDIKEFLNFKHIYDLYECDYEFDRVLNNRAKTTDKASVVNDMYIKNCEIALTDFGNAYVYSSRTVNEIQDRRYRAPEVILDLNYGYGVDIWSVACVVFELLTGFVLFDPYYEPLTADIHHLFLLETHLGPMPIKMKQASKRRNFLFDRQRKWNIKNVERIKPYSLEQRLVRQHLFSKKEAHEISAFLLSGLTYEPAKRATAREMMNHPWLRV